MGLHTGVHLCIHILVLVLVHIHVHDILYCGINKHYNLVSYNFVTGIVGIGEAFIDTIAEFVVVVRIPVRIGLR